MRLSLAALALCFALPAAADTQPDQGPELANDPYHHNVDLTTGRIAGFRQLYGDPDALADGLSPLEPADGTADLPVINTRSAWSRVAIDGVEIGVIGPYDEGLIQGVEAGVYEVQFTLPNGFTWARRIGAGVEVPPPNETTVTGGDEAEATEEEGPGVEMERPDDAE